MIPLYGKVLPLIIILWSVLWIVKGSFKSKVASLNRSSLFLVPVFFYVLHIIGMLYTNNVSSGLFDLEVKFSLFLFPILIFSEREYFQKNKMGIYVTFLLGNLIACLICVINSFLNVFVHGNGFLDYTEFSIFYHPSYASMYAIFSIVIVLFLFFNDGFKGLLSDYPKLRWLKIIDKKSKPLVILLITILCSYIYFLGSRTGIITAIIILSFYVLRNFFIKERWVLFITVLIGCIVVPYFIVTNHPRFMNAVNFITTFENTVDISSEENTTVRYLVLVQSLNVIQNNFIIGTGTGDVKDELIKQYETNKIKAAAEQRLNAHNQFLETFIGLGILGLICLLLMLGILLYYGILYKNLLLIFFSIIISLNFFFESMLNMQGGVLFFAFFFSLLLIPIHNLSNPETQ